MLRRTRTIDLMQMRRLQQSEIGCCRWAAELGVSAALITGILRVSRKRLLAVGITMRELRQAAGGVSNARRTIAARGIPHRFKLGRMNRSFPDRGAPSIVRRRRLRAVNKEEDRSGHERSGRGPDRRRGKSRLGLAHCINQCRRRWKQPPPALLGSGSRSSACDDHTTLTVSIGGISSISARPSTRFARRSRRDP